MKRKNHIYLKLLDFRNINKAFNNVLKNVKNKKTKLDLKQNKIFYITKIKEILEAKKYIPGEKRCFFVNESGKRREVYNQKPIDKIINNLVSLEILYNAIIPKLIDQNVASRPGLGTEMGLMFFYKYIMDSNRQWKKYYIIKCDIHKFFASINHDILKIKLKKAIKDKDALDILFTIIDSDKEGLSLGSMTSQVLAIFYLNDLDHFIKEKLHIKKYVRYQDDFLLFVKTKKEAKKLLREIKIFVEKEDLKLNKSSRIYSSNENIKYLGKTKKGKNVKNKKIMKKYKQCIEKYKKGEKNLNSVQSTLNNYIYRIGKKVLNNN